MRQNAKKFGLTLATLILAVLLVGTAVLAPCLVSAQDGEGGLLILNASEIRLGGSPEREPVAPNFASPGGGDILFEQPPSGLSDPAGAYPADVCFELRMFDDFWGVTGDIGDIHWYGITVDLSSGYDCSPTGMEFEIIFREDAGGIPGAQVAVFSNVIPAITYYDTYYETAVYRFEAELGTPVSLTEGWVSIQGIYSPYGCPFLWLNSPAGNGNAVFEEYRNPGYFNYFFDNLAFALTEFTPPPAPIPPNVKYLHSTRGLFNLTEPTDTQWHELRPIFSREYHLSSWEDNGDRVLSYCDTINMYEKPDGELRPYHVENVTITLLVTNNVTGEPMYIELEGGYNASILTYPPGPLGTQWHEVYPEFCSQYNVTDWAPTGNPRTELDYCDYIILTPEGGSPLACPLDEGFSGGFPPGWATDDWLLLPLNMWGTPPEAVLLSDYISNNYAYLESKPVHTTGAARLTLEFKSIIAADGANCTVYTRANSSEGWTDVTPWSNPISGGVGPGTYSVDISPHNGSATQVLFEFDGDPQYIYGWCVDDVRICYPVSWHVEDVAVDIIVTPEPPPVGGEAYPVSRVSVLAPWIAVGVVLAGGAVWYVLRRRRAQR